MWEKLSFSQLQQIWLTYQSNSRWWSQFKDKNITPCLRRLNDFIRHNISQNRQQLTLSDKIILIQILIEMEDSASPDSDISKLSEQLWMGEFNLELRQALGITLKKLSESFAVKLILENFIKDIWVLKKFSVDNNYLKKYLDYYSENYGGGKIHPAHGPLKLTKEYCELIIDSRFDYNFVYGIKNIFPLLLRAGRLEKIKARINVADWRYDFWNAVNNLDYPPEKMESILDELINSSGNRQDNSPIEFIAPFNADETIARTAFPNSAALFTSPGCAETLPTTQPIFSLEGR